MMRFRLLAPWRCAKPLIFCTSIIVLSGLALERTRFETLDPIRSAVVSIDGERSLDKTGESSVFFLSNGSFENDLSGWTPVGTATTTTTNAYSGLRSLFVTDDAAAAFSYVYQPLNLTFGNDKIEFWVFPESATYRTHFGMITGWNTPSAEYQTHVQFEDYRTIFLVAGSSESSDVTLIPNAWNQVLIYVNQGTQTQQLRINNELVSEITVTEDFDPTEHILVGDLSVPADFGTVYFDEISLSGSGTVSSPTVVAVDDHFVDNGPGEKFLPVLNNDVIPFGVQVEIFIDEPPEHGEITGIEPDGVWYRSADGFEGADKLGYSLTVVGKNGNSISSEGAQSSVDIFECWCVALIYSIELDNCIDFNENRHFGEDSNASPAQKMASALDFELLMRGREAARTQTDLGAQFIDALLLNSPEILQEIWVRPELVPKIIYMFELIQGPVANLLDGDGAETLTQEAMDAVDDFLTDLSTYVSGELRTNLEEQVEAIGPFSKYVGMSVADAYSSLGDVTDTENEASIPSDFVLEQNFPNPFETSTRISYTLLRPSAVSLIVFDVQGRQVRTLVNAAQTQGPQSLDWDGRDDTGNPVASGIYLFRLETESGRRSKSMVLRR